MENDISSSQSSIDPPGTALATTGAAPDLRVTDPQDVLDWERQLPIPPQRHSGFVRVRLVDLGRDKPIPAEDPTPE